MPVSRNLLLAALLGSLVFFPSVAFAAAEAEPDSESSGIEQAASPEQSGQSQKSEQSRLPPQSQESLGRSVIWLGFPIIDRSRQPAEINLAADESLGSAFLLQLRRQALLLAAREELGALTRDAFLDEPPSEGAVEVPDIDAFPGADLKYVDHRQFLADAEKLSREVFVAELQKAGLQKSEYKKPEKPPSEESKQENGDVDSEAADLEAVDPEAVDPEKREPSKSGSRFSKINDLLGQWALVPQFEAVRRTHEQIRAEGESLPLLALLVRGYTQLQMMTNIAPRDTHRVFQARAMLYAQRAVAKYGENPQTLSLRAAAWSLNNFHRLGREEFAAIPAKETKDGTAKKKTASKFDAWVDLGRAYADYDFKRLEELAATDDVKMQRPLARLLHFMLLDESNNDDTLTRPFGEAAIADLPDCSRLYHGVFTINKFDMVHAPDGSMFYEHLQRQICPNIRKMKELPASVKKAVGDLRKTLPAQRGGLFSSLFGRETKGKKTYYTELAALLKSLSESAENNDRSEPSLAMLAVLIKDDEFKSVGQLGYGASSHNGALETYVEPALPLINDHPAMEYLAMGYRDEALKAPFWARLKRKSIPYNLLSQYCTGLDVNVFDTEYDGLFYSSNFIACMFADRENVRDMCRYYGKTVWTIPSGQYFFVVDLLFELCPKNPRAVGARIARGKNVDLEEAGRLYEKFGEYPNVRGALTEYYQRNNQPEKRLEMLQADYDANPTYELVNQLVDEYLRKNDSKKALSVMKHFARTPEADQKLHRAKISERIGYIFLQDGKFEEAEPYFEYAAETHSGWGLRSLAIFRELTGRFEEARELFLIGQRSYPESGPFEWWGCCYRTNHAELPEATEAIVARYGRFREAVARLDSANVTPNETKNYQIIFPCYCTGHPFPKSLGEDPLVDKFLEDANGILGFLAWFEAVEKGDREKAERLLKLLRDFWFFDEKVNPFLEKQRLAMPILQNRISLGYYSQMLAALFELDQRSEKPGSLKPEEVDYLVHVQQGSDNDNTFLWVLYLLGRYYTLCGEQEKGLECYRRALGIRYLFDDYLRALIVRELRKAGLAEEDYLKFSQSDPGISHVTISYDRADVFCRQHFRDYSESPSTSLLARPVAANPAKTSDFGKPTPLVSGFYKVTNILFRGDSIPENETVLYWRIPETGRENDKNWGTYGIAAICSFETDLQEPRPDGAYPLRLGVGETALSALAAFSDGSLALVVSLKPGEVPTSLTPEPGSNCVRVEMRKVADIPPEEPFRPVEKASPRPALGKPRNQVPPTEKVSLSPASGKASNGQNGKTPGLIAEPEEDSLSFWFDAARIAALAVAGFAVVSVVALIIVKKTRRIG